MISGQSICVDYRNSDSLVKRQTVCDYRDTAEMDRTPFGQRLHDARKAAGYTQEAAAKEVGMSQGTLADAEIEGKRSGYTPQLAALYGVNAAWLATGRGSKTDSTVSVVTPPISQTADPLVATLVAAFLQLDPLEQELTAIRVKGAADEALARRKHAAQQPPAIPRDALTDPPPPKSKRSKQAA